MFQFVELAFWVQRLDFWYRSAVVLLEGYFIPILRQRVCFQRRVVRQLGTRHKAVWWAQLCQWQWLRTRSLKYARSLVQGKLSNTMSTVKEEKQSRNLKYFNLGWSKLSSGLGESPLFCLSPSLGLIQHQFSLKPGVVDELRTSIRISYSRRRRPEEVCRTWQSCHRLNWGTCQGWVPKPAGLHLGLPWLCGFLSWNFKVALMYNASSPNPD